MNLGKINMFLNVWISALFLIFLGNECQCLQNVRLLIPFAIQRGHPAVFQCLYDLEGDALYSLKWYKGLREFYRFTPTDNPPLKIFPLTGLNVDLKLSNSSHLFLHKVELTVSGKYSCEVSADAPSFHTALVTGETHVVEIPKHTPTIHDIKPKYRIGDILRANCTSIGSKPAANLTWYINGEPAEPKFVKHYRKYYTEYRNLETSHIGLRFSVDRHHFKNGHLKVRCVASLYNIYWKSTEKSVDEERPKLSIYNAVTPNTLGVNQLPNPNNYYDQSTNYFDEDFLTETRHHHSINMVQYAGHHPSLTSTTELPLNSSVGKICENNILIILILICTAVHLDIVRI